MITKREARRLFEYRGGKLYWKIKRRGTKGIGNEAGGKGPNGKTIIRVNPHGGILAHRLIWIWHNGQVPKKMVVDHINRDLTDHRIENLRCCTLAENLLNRTVGKNSKTGLKNITRGRNGKYCVCIRREFPTKKAAIAFRDKTLSALHGEFASYG